MRQMQIVDVWFFRGSLYKEHRVALTGNTQFVMTVRERENVECIILCRDP